MLELITVSLADKKAESLRVLELGRASAVADYFIIATGNSPPHLHALSEDTVIRLRKSGIPGYRREGQPDSGWMVLDYGIIVVHLMLDEARRYYSLENLWNDAVEIPTDADGKLQAPVAKPRAPRAAKPKAKAKPADAKARKPAARRKPKA